MSERLWVLEENQPHKRHNMGKKRIVTSQGENSESSAVTKKSGSSKKQLYKGIITIFSSYNNTIVSVSDLDGRVVVWSSAGLLGFKGARKSTPYAATLIGKDAVEKAKNFGLQEATVSVKGIGPGREGAIRGVIGSGVNVISIIDDTPIAHNGTKPAKPRRV